MCKILVIEDDPIVRANTVDLLKEEGYDVLEAENGKIGIEKAKANIPDLIISDIMMPEADGFTVYRELQNNILTSSIPFIFLSAKSELRDIRFGMNIGAEDYITKPFRSYDLLKTIDTCLQKGKKVNNCVNDSISQPFQELIPSNILIRDFSEIIKDNPVELSKEEIRNLMNYAYSGRKKTNKLNQRTSFYRELEGFLKDKKSISAFRNCCTNSVGKVIYNAIIKTSEKFERRNDLMIDIQDGKISIFQKHLEIAVSEVVDNAFRYSKKGTSISIYSSVQDNKYMLNIINSRKNMMEEQINSSDDFSNFDYDGNMYKIGLGLGIVKKITALYDGLITITGIYGIDAKVKLEFKNYHI